MVAAVGPELPEDEVIDGYSGYSSRWFTLGSQHVASQWWWKVLFLRIATPERPYFIAFFPIENQRWLLSYIGVNKAYPPTREDEFTAALARLVSPVVHEMVRRMEPISPCIPAARRRTDGAITSGGGHRSAGSSRLPTRPVRTTPVWPGHERRRGIRTDSRTAWPRTASLTRACQAPVLLRAGAVPEDAVAASRQPTTCGFPATAGKRSVSVRLFNWYRPKLAACPDRQVGARLGEVTPFVRPMCVVRAPGGLARPRRGDVAADQGHGAEGFIRWPSSDATGRGMIAETAALTTRQAEQAVAADRKFARCRLPAERRTSALREREARGGDVLWPGRCHRKVSSFFHGGRTTYVIRHSTPH